MIQPVLPVHECANPSPAEPPAKPLYSVADSTAAKADANPATVESLHFAADPAGSGVALTEIFCLCVGV
jgi:hypothetical protein